MTLRCIDPVMSEALLDCARVGGPPFAPEHVAHLDGCAACRQVVEQRRRVAVAWQAIEPGHAELRAARSRFLGARPSRRRSRKVLTRVATVLAVVLAAAVASAAVRVVAVRIVGPSAAAVVPVVSLDDLPKVIKKNARRIWRGASGVLAPAPVSATATAAPAEALPPADLPVEVADAGIAGEPQVQAGAVEVSVEQLPVAPALAPAPASAPAPAHRVASPPAPASTPSSWTVAATAMREGDYAGAEAAFADLASSSDAPTRDAARLARAQVWIAQGKASQARPELESLSTGGATPLVRKRAAEALDALP